MTHLRYAWRTLRRSPGFSLIAVLTLGLGIGANTVLFSLVQGVLLDPLPYRDSGRLVNIWNDLGEGAQSLPAVSPLDYLDYRKQAELFEDFAAGSGGNILRHSGVLGGDGSPQRVDISLVTSNFFPLLGIEPALGRHFEPSEEAHRGPLVVLISDELWKTRYGGNPALVGQTIQLDGRAHQVVGIMPLGFRLQLPAEAFQIRHSDVWAPMQYDYANAPPRNYTLFTVFGRLKPGVTIEQAQAEMDAIAERFRQEHQVHRNSNLRIRAIPLQQDVVKGVRPALLTLMGAVGFVLLIACANVANLLLTRASSRQRELAIQSALGGGRRSIVARLMTESLLLAAGGIGLGLALAQWGLSGLQSLQPANLPRLENVAINPAVLGFAAAAGLVAVMLFGLLPAVQASRTDIQGALQEGGRSSVSAGGSGLRRLLVTAEVALSLMLLVGTGLMIRSFHSLQQVRPGFDPHNVLTFRLNLPQSLYPDGKARLQLFEEIKRRLSASAGVDRVSFISQLPLTGSGPLQPYAFDEETARNWESVTAESRWVDQDYFQTMGTRLLAGRLFEESDKGGPPRVIIDNILADRAFPDGQAVGQRLQVNPTGSQNQDVEVIGVVEHQRMLDVGRDVREVIFKYYTWGPRNLDFVVRHQGGSQEIAALVRQEIRRLDASLPVQALQPMSAYLDDALGPARLNLILMSLFGILALLLASVGIYGVISYSVSRRTHEIGVRLALGGDPRRIRRLVVGQGMRPVLAGILLGGLGSLLLAGTISSLLYNVNPIDPLTIAAISALLLLVSLLACLLPARRASRISPTEALLGN